MYETTKVRNNERAMQKNETRKQRSNEKAMQKGDARQRKGDAKQRNCETTKLRNNKSVKGRDGPTRTS